MNMTSWRTTLGGILAAAGAVLSAFAATAEIGHGLSAAGLLVLGVAARDNLRTSEQVGARDATEFSAELRETEPVSAEALYLAFCAAAAGRKAPPNPAWKDLDPETRALWEAVAVAR